MRMLRWTSKNTMRAIIKNEKSELNDRVKIQGIVL